MSSEWPTILLGEMVTHKKGFAFKSSDYQDGGVPVVRVSNFTNDSIGSTDLKFVSTAIAELNAGVALKTNDIVVATVGSWPNNPASVVGRTISVPAWVSGGLMNQNSVILRAKSGKSTDQAYIYYQMKSEAFPSHVISKAQGSANQASITLDAIFSFPIFWPAVTDRQTVAESLTALDDRIILLRETNATLEAIAQALFKSWFVDFDPVRAKLEGRAPEGMDEATAALFPDGLEESELGLVPRGWGVGVLGDITQTVRRQLQPSDLHADINYVGLEHIPRKSLSLLSWGTADGLESAKATFSDGDILFGKLRPYFHKVVVAPFDGVCSTDILVCQARKSAYYGVVVMQLFSTTLIDYAERLSNGAKMPRVGWKDIAAYPLVIPSEPVAGAYSSFIEPLLARMKANVHEAQTLATLRDTLLPRLISGALRLPEVESLIEESVV